jgi:hypothetical protein
MSCSILTCLTKKAATEGFENLCQAEPKCNIYVLLRDSYSPVSVLRHRAFFWTPYSILIALKALEDFSSILRSIALNVR